MTIARRLAWYLGKNRVDYDVLEHRPSSTSIDSAQKARISAHHLAKSVLLEDDRGYVSVLLPADCLVDVDVLCHQLDRDLELATEPEIADIFFDCALGAIPGLVQPYGIPSIVDESLFEAREVYLESGDHETLVHMSQREFSRMMANCSSSRFSRTE